MQIAYLLYEGLTVLDIIGPYEVLSRLPGASPCFVAAKPGEVRSDTGLLGLVADRGFSDVPHPDVFVVPGGGAGTLRAAQDPEVQAWVRSAHERSRYSTSVCTGALILGATGLLRGLRATTHWAAKDMLAPHGASYVAERVVEEGRVITAAGVSAGIDMALTLAARIAGEEVARAIQLAIEYDPSPPFDAGSPAKAGESTVARALEALAAGM